MSSAPPPLASGQRILHFTLAEKLGEGGMGVVWRAIDTSLDRPVALKALPPGFAGDPERLARFEREARLLASLNHPNIATVFSVHVVEGVRYLSMELVPGEDLAQRIARGPIPVPEALEIARQIALALEAAHESGVVHRDLKPANVRIMPDGRVKVLDFGLAKALEGGAAPSALSQSPTYAVSAMTTGMIIGTATYMSPEQARGQSVDRRADIWAFGVVLYEMLTGRRAFEGETVSDTLAGVLRSEPDRTALPSDLPPPIRTLLDRCLEKNARRRLRDIGEAVLTIEDVQAGRLPPAPAAAGAPSPRAATAARAWWGWPVAAVLLVALAWSLADRGARPAPLRKYTLTLDEGGGQVSDVCVSPNGRMVAYVRQGRLMVRDLAQTGSRELADGLSENFRPAWSPGSEALVVGVSGRLERVEVGSGTVTQLCPVLDFSGGSGATWLKDGSIVFARGHDHLYRVPETGGSAEVYLARDERADGDLHHPCALPGGRGVIYVRHLADGGPVVLAMVAGGKRRDLMRLASGYMWQPVYDPHGYIVFTRGGEVSGLWAVPFSLARLAITGEPRMIAPGGSSASVADDGTLFYRLGESAYLHSEVVWLHRSGAVGDTLLRDVGNLWSMALAPDGQTVALDIRPYGDPDIWLADLDRHSLTRFAFGPGPQITPDWSPDGRTVYFRDESSHEILARPADGAQAARALVPGTWPRATPDGTHLLCSRPSAAGDYDIWYVSIDGRDSVRVVGGPGNQDQATPCPRGGYFLYQSDEGGSSEIYLRPYPSGDTRWQVTTAGGTWPQWSLDGNHIYYWRDRKYFEVDVTLEPAVRLGSPRMLFDAAALTLQTWGRYTLLPTRDPNLFLAEQRVQHNIAGRVDAIAVENWPAEFAKPK